MDWIAQSETDLSMTPSSPIQTALLSEIETLRLRLEEAEGTLEGIRSGAVDALVIGGQVYSLESAERPYHELVDRMTEGAAFLSQDGVILYANRYLADLLDIPLASLAGTPWLARVSTAERARIQGWLTGSDRRPLEGNLITPTGALRPVELSGAALSLAGQPGYAVLVTDRRAHLAAEAKILRLNRLYAMASAVNATIARQPERADLFQAFCQIAVDQGGHRLAWIGLPDPASGAIMIVAAAGHTGYLDGLELSSRDVPAGRGPSGIALREGRCVAVNDFLQAELTRPWREPARRHGLRSAASVPFTKASVTDGVFTLYSGETNRFGDAELALLQQMGADLSFALEQTAQAERLREQATLINLAHDAILIRQANGVIDFWNQGAEQTYGWRCGEALGQVTHQLLATVFPESRSAQEAALAAADRWDGELTHTRRDGTPVIVASRQVFLRGADGGGGPGAGNQSGYHRPESG